LIARRLMYWQVYLHKTVVSAEQMLIKTLKRAKYLSSKGTDLFATPALSHFLKNSIDQVTFEEKVDHLYYFSQLDDTDILASLKVWAQHEDTILSMLCKGIMSRNLNRVEMSNEIPNDSYISELRKLAMDKYKLSEEDTEYIIYSQTVSNSAYQVGEGHIQILMKDGSIQDITSASDLSNLEVLSKKVQKHIVSYPKELYNIKRINA
jgi:HD superfamily phosphohydrolase